jgi:hypothetical protein
MLRWGHIRLFSPFGMNSSTEGQAALRAANSKHDFPAETDLLTGRQHAATYLEPLAALLKEHILTETRVVSIGRRGYLKTHGAGDKKRGEHPFLLLVRHKNLDRTEKADIVLDCSGVYGQHRWMGSGGIPAAGEMAAESQIRYGLDDVLGEHKNLYMGKTILLYGGGYSAASTACLLAELGKQVNETWVHWLARTASPQPITRIAKDPLRERDRLAQKANLLATRSDDNVEFSGQASILSVESLGQEKGGQEKGYKVTAQLGKTLKTWEVDRIVANVGYAPDTQLYRELHVHECYASQGPMTLAAKLSGSTDCLNQPVLGVETFMNPEPNFFILGSKSYGRNSHFLLQVGFQQVNAVLAHLATKWSGK